jgi:acetate kinase
MNPADYFILTINGGSSSVKFALYREGQPLRACNKITVPI